MKKILILGILLIFGISFAKGATSNNVTWYIWFSYDGKTKIPSSSLNLSQFSATFTWNGETVTIPGTSVPNCAIKDVGGYAVLQITLQAFKSGFIPVQSEDPVKCLVNLALTLPSGDVITMDIPRTKFSTTEQIYANITPPVADPTINIANSTVCAGGDKTDITIGNVTDYSKYSIKVFSGATDVTDKFTIGALGATTEIKAKAGTTAGSYTVKLIDNADASKEYAANLTVNAAAVISITVPNTQKDGADAYYCSGGSDKSTVVLTANGPSGYTYAWEKDGAAIAGAGSVTANQPGVYKVKGTHTTGCPGEATVTVGEKTAPVAPAITAPAKADVCVEDGGSTTLAVTSPNAGYTYIWTGATAGTPTSSATVQHSSVAHKCSRFAIYGKSQR